MLLTGENNVWVPRVSHQQGQNMRDYHNKSRLSEKLFFFKFVFQNSKLDLIVDSSIIAGHFWRAVCSNTLHFEGNCFSTKIRMSTILSTFAGKL